MEDEPIASELNLLAQKEEWIRAMATRVSEAMSLDAEIALMGARWASLWIDEFNERFGTNPPTSRDELKDLLIATQASTLERCEGVPRYPTGLPSVRAIIAAQESFCLTYEDEGQDVRELFQ